MATKQKAGASGANFLTPDSKPLPNSYFANMGKGKPMAKPQAKPAAKPKAKMPKTAPKNMGTSDGYMVPNKYSKKKK